MTRPNRHLDFGKIARDLGREHITSEWRERQREKEREREDEQDREDDAEASEAEAMK